MTRGRLAISLDEKPSDADVAAVVAALRAFNERKTGRPLDASKFAVYVRDAEGEIVGGCIGITYWDWLYVDYLWLDEKLHRRGWGRRMLERAEGVARKRGCRGVWLDTFSFQSPGFYGRMGYREFGKMTDHPTGASRHFFWKPLTQSRHTPARRR